MPIYEFVCLDCNKMFEELCKSEQEIPECPNCHAQNVKKRMASPSPLKKGAFPYTPKGVHPLAGKMGGGSGCPGGCH